MTRMTPRSLKQGVVGSSPTWPSKNATEVTPEVDKRRPLLIFGLTACAFDRLATSPQDLVGVTVGVNTTHSADASHQGGGDRAL